MKKVSPKGKKCEQKTHHSKRTNETYHDPPKYYLSRERRQASLAELREVTTENPFERVRGKEADVQFNGEQQTVDTILMR